MTHVILEAEATRLRNTEERQAQIAQRYLDYREKYQNVSANKILRAVAEDFAMTSEGVKYILKRKGLYNVARA